MNTQRKHAAALLCTALVCAASNVYAQEPPVDPGQIAFLTSSSSSTTALGLAYMGYAIIETRQEKLQREVLIMQQVTMIDDYMKANEVGVRMAFALASGEELDELAALMGHGATLTRAQRRALRAERAGLIAAFERGDDARPLAGAAHVHSVFSNMLRAHTMTEALR